MMAPPSLLATDIVNYNNTFNPTLCSSAIDMYPGIDIYNKMGIAYAMNYALFSGCIISQSGIMTDLSTIDPPPLPVFVIV